MKILDDWVSLPPPVQLHLEDTTQTTTAVPSLDIRGVTVERPVQTETKKHDHKYHERSLRSLDNPSPFRWIMARDATYPESSHEKCNTHTHDTIHKKTRRIDHFVSSQLMGRASAENPASISSKYIAKKREKIDRRT